MYSLITIIIVFICILLMIIVLVQNPKGGGLGAGFGGGSANVMGGVKQTTDFLDKTTWGLAITLFVLSIVSNAFLPEKQTINDQNKTTIENIIEDEGGLAPGGEE